jgi:response regulator RpfG family c-di-GMP phosphodiesterase
MNIANYLGRSDLFSGLGLQTIELIGQRFQPVTYAKSAFIFHEGDRGDSYYVVATGEVVLYKGQGISRRELKRMGSGQGFGEMALISNEPRSASVQAVTDTDLLRLSHEDFMILMDQEARFAQRILRVLSTRLKQTDEVATMDLMRAHQGLIISLAQLAESRDADTGAHLYRVRDYCTLLSKLMAQDSRYSSQITPAFIEGIYHVSPLHDIGKVAIPDNILKKHGKLTEDEFDVIKTHTTIGANSLNTVLKYCDLEMFHMAQRLIWGHHERFDGKGYPRGLRGEEIPLEARIMSIADFYDALLSARVYKEAWSHDKVIEMIREESGAKFDPAVVAIMLENIDEFEKIYLSYLDQEAKTVEKT